MTKKKNIGQLISIIKLLKSTLFPFLFLFSFTSTIGQVPDSIMTVDKKNTVTPTKDSYLFVYDGLYDMTGSAQDLLSISHLFGRGLDELTRKPGKKAGSNSCCEKENIIGRVLKDFGLNYFFTNWLSTVQHEYMGHGNRIREFHVKVNRYDISPALFGQPQPYFNKNDLPYYGKVLEDVGGSESNTLFAREAFRESLSNNYFYHYYIFSFALKLDLPFYIIGSPKVGSNGWNTYLGGGWDVVEYIKDFKTKSGNSEQAIYNRARKGALWSFADPSLLISLFNYGRDYIGQGKARVKNPMIKISRFSFLPFTDFHLSPFGYEYYAGSYLKYNRLLYEAYYRWSNGNIDGKGYGLGMNISNIVQYHNFRFDAGFDLWKQGFNLRYYEKDSAKYEKPIHSGKIYLKSFYQVNNTFSFFGQISYKGDGFLLGNPVKKGFNIKIGSGFYF